MIERAIENWLINTNEKNYQIPFCQVLLNEGQTILYISSHRPMEQGKDIISIDKDGNCNAYQLKTGKIDINRWRTIKGEINELIELPVVHPNVNKNRIHNSFFVTNGEITDELRIQIDQINEDNIRKNRNYSYLKVITQQELFKKFINAKSKFIPTEIKDFHLFLDIFNTDGTDFINKKKYYELIAKMIFKDFTISSDRINAISSSIIINSYLLNSFQLQKNHYALFESWVMLGGFIINYVNKYDIKQKNWISSYNLVFDEIIRNLKLLRNETLEKEHLIEGDPFSDDKLLYDARVTILLGTISALEIYLGPENINAPSDKKIIELIKKNSNRLFFGGESAFPFFFYIIKYLEQNHEEELATKLLKDILLFILNLNSPKSNIGALFNPYYNINDILEEIYKISPQKIDFTQFVGSSFTLESVVSMLVRRNQREIIEKNWRRISYFQYEGFIPEEIYDNFIWHSEKGVNFSKFPNQTQSWKELVDEAKNLDCIPKLLKDNINFLRFFILVCPYRVSKELISLLDQKL